MITSDNFFAILLISWYLFAPEIDKARKGNVLNIIIFTIISALFIAKKDIILFIEDNIFWSTVSLSLLSLFFCIVYKPNIQKPKKYLITIKEILFFRLNQFHFKIIRILYLWPEEMLLREIEKFTWSIGWNQFRVLLLSILLFDHFLSTFTQPSRILLFYFCLTVASILFYARVIRKYPLRILTGILLMPWIILLPFHYYLNSIGVESPFYAIPNLINYLQVDSGNWISITFRLCCLLNLGLLFQFFMVSLLSFTGEIIFRSILKLTKTLLKFFPIFSSKTAKKRLLIRKY